MNVVTVDFETFWSQTHTLSKMNPIAYVMHPETEIISLAIKINDAPTKVYFGEVDVAAALAAHDWSDTMVVGHNMSAFDSMLLAWRFGVTPKVWACTLAMARPIHAKTCGLSLGALVKHYGIGEKNNTALVNTKGKHLCDFTAQELRDMRAYNRDDTEQCYALFNILRQHYSASELWQIDATIRMLVEPKFLLNRRALETALGAEIERKHNGLVAMAKTLYGDDYDESDTLVEDVRSRLASAPKFSQILKSQGVDVPMKVSPTNPDKMIPALSKTDEAFIALQDHENEIVALAAATRLDAKSTILQTRIESFIATGKALRGKLPIPLHYCGADTTGRWSGFIYNPQNLPRIDPTKPKLSDALRTSMAAPAGYAVVVADLSGIELRVNHFLWKVPSSMSLYLASPGDADLYRDFASKLYGKKPDDVEKSERQMGKVCQLGLGFGAGAGAFRRVAKTMGGVDLSEAEAKNTTYRWRDEYPEIVDGWRTCHESLHYIAQGDKILVDPWGMVHTERNALVLPSGRKIRYPALRTEANEGKVEWVYGSGRHRARIYAGKIDENIVQGLARDIVAQNAYDVYKRTKHRPVLMVHDELVYVVPEAQAHDLLATVNEIMRTPPTWWPELITWSAGDVARTYGDAK